MSLPAAPLGRVLTAMVTPFKDDGSVDLDGVARVAEYLVANGNDGIVVSGTTGEAPTTSVAEDGEILRAVIDAVGDRATVVAGIGTNHTEHSIELNEQAAKAGADGVLLVSPYYNKPTQAGIAAHFEAVAAASELPIMLYDIPGRTGVTIAPETFARVAANEKFVAVKDAVGDLFRGTQIMAETGLAYYSGDDVLNLGWLTHGGCGVVSVVGHVAGNQYAEMVAAVDAGDLDRALRLYNDVAPVVDAIMNHAPGVMTAKAAIQLLGVHGNRTVRLPLVEADDQLVGAVHEALANAGLLPITPTN
ncbi:4-hydroxy-tetrahydrodipicolinate synthase [Nocardioides marmoriginsengisoli]|uniref:4-hydroxy-tetrahydrodipicolinate synthase n=1 Tax=Nocardioides marmoriginsengisoli TaxID=661483 RepID=A0A3N0CNK7_9ACTN|nr:4-hydroxy-tetrahydrodipicolinate synthase [Nocardioides marmoriginsengisoli]RNL65052.1 4-hydroxy-tetrahydrodipicolinate synthase [Nocardioides marmoriginsengisoli]